MFGPPVHQVAESVPPPTLGFGAPGATDAVTAAACATRAAVALARASRSMSRATLCTSASSSAAARLAIRAVRSVSRAVRSASLSLIVDLFLAPTPIFRQRQTYANAKLTPTPKPFISVCLNSGGDLSTIPRGSLDSARLIR